jgi:hypothetical protein
MRTTLAAAASGLLALIGAPALAADCSNSFTPNSDGYSLIFDNFSADSPTPEVCHVTPAAAPVAPGEVAVYSADYRGALDPDATGKMTVVNGNHTFVFNPTTGDDPLDYTVSDFVGTRDGVLDSTITLQLPNSTIPFSFMTLDTVDYLELARTTDGDIQAAADQLAAGHTALMTHLNGTMDLLTGAGQRLDAPDGVGGFAGFGSFSAGVTFKHSLEGGFAVLGGGGLINQSAGGADANGVVGALALRYLAPDDGTFRPFAEIGVRSAPHLDLGFRHDLETSTGTQSTTAESSGATLGGYIKGGVLVAPTPDSEIVFSATLAEDWLHVDGFAETLDATNLFAFDASEASGSFTTAKLGVDWTTTIAPDIELTLSGAVGRTIANDDVPVNVAFAGSYDGAAQSESFVEYGARLGYAVNDMTDVGLFVHGTTGEVSGTHTQIGGDFRVRF